MGRPTSYTPELAAAICERLAAGESLRAVCRDDGMPAESTVRGWAVDVAEFSAHYTRARDIGLDIVAADCIDIADEDPGIINATGGVDSAAVAHQRLRFDARRWYLSKLAPKRYGDKLEVGGKLEVEVNAANRILAARKRVGG